MDIFQNKNSIFGATKFFFFVKNRLFAESFVLKKGQLATAKNCGRGALLSPQPRMRHLPTFLVVSDSAEFRTK
jgi:hypothetical protein